MGDSIRKFDDLALGSNFIEFMDDCGQANFGELQQWMDSQFQTVREKLLGSFLLSATGCWLQGAEHADVAEEVASHLNSTHEITDSGCRESVLDTVTYRFQEKESKYSSRHEWIHNHRRRYLYSQGSPAEMAEAVVESIESASDLMNPEKNFAAYLERHFTSSSDPFYSIHREFSRVDGFSRLSTFDFLEIAYRAGQIPHLYPRLPRYDYVQSNNPQPGFNLVVTGEKSTDAINRFGHEKCNAITRMIVDEVLSDCGWEYDTAMFDVESCLCNFAKERHSNYRERTSCGGNRGEMDSDSRIC